MHGARRVATFCILTAVLPTLLIIIPLYLRHSLFADVIYQVAESDVFEIREGISSIFCEEHVLHMNTSFSAYQLNKSPDISTSNSTKHVKLRKSMRLPDDTLEYWGFYLLNGATVTLKACSRYEGGRILVVRGERNLRTCGLLEHNQKKVSHLDKEYKQVEVTFETASHEVVLKKGEEKKDSLVDLNTAEEEMDDDEIEKLKKYAERFLEKRLSKKNSTTEQSSNTKCKNNDCASTETHTMRHGRKRQEEIEKIMRLREELNEVEGVKNRRKREVGHKLDGAIGHGGNAINYTEGISEESAVSSFENNLLTCYDGQILVTQEFTPSHLCTDVNFIEKGIKMRVSHKVNSDGYYYYIFYSDNDLISNDIHAIFDIYKPTFQQFTNASDTKQCINQTTCTFSVSFFSGETVIVEVPTRDGIEHEPDDITQLVSICKPRMAVYMIFPILILFLILGCAFL